MQCVCSGVWGEVYWSCEHSKLRSKKERKQRERRERKERQAKEKLRQVGGYGWEGMWVIIDHTLKYSYGLFG